MFLLINPWGQIRVKGHWIVNVYKHVYIIYMFTVSRGTPGIFGCLSRYSCLLCQCNLVQYGPLWPISRDEPLQADVNVPNTAQAALCTWVCTWHIGRLPSGCLRLQHSSLSLPLLLVDPFSSPDLGWLNNSTPFSLSSPVTI